jgi:hypothetical protein
MSFCLDCDKETPDGIFVCKDCWAKDKTPIEGREKYKTWLFMERQCLALEQIAINLSRLVSLEKGRGKV